MEGDIRSRTMDDVTSVQIACNSVTASRLVPSWSKPTYAVTEFPFVAIAFLMAGSEPPNTCFLCEGAYYVDSRELARCCAVELLSEQGAKLELARLADKVYDHRPQRSP